MTDEHGGRYLARTLPSDAKAILERRLREINRLLLPLDTNERVQAGAAISAMLTGYPNARVADTRAAIAHFTAVLQEFPLWAIREACQKISNGRLPDLSPDFAPSAPRMYRAVAECLLELQREKFQITEILEAKPKDEKPVDEQERERITLGFQKLKATLEYKTVGDHTEAQRKKADADRRAIARNDQAIIEEWRRAGLEPMFANERPVSMSFAKMTGALQRQIERGFSPSTAADLEETASQ